ncbi:histidine kinase [Streptomyces sp. NPDC004539]|uniref:histidine kinase n=1 Tax=Streptomyces sp. NPDC004539 TaxID=3154280 RepID=UPI0033B1468C
MVHDRRARLAEAGERARISREMHDILGHALAVVVVRADGAAELAETKPKRGVPGQQAPARRLRYRGPRHRDHAAARRTCARRGHGAAFRGTGSCLGG